MQRFLFLFFLTIALDQLSKAVAQFLGLEVVVNPGISLALLGGHTQVAIILLSLGLLVLISLSYGYFWAKHPLVAGLFFGGAFSNLIDRLWIGGVRDWMSFPFFGLRNNLADYAIGVSLLLIVWELKREGEHG